MDDPQPARLEGDAHGPVLKPWAIYRVRLPRDPRDPRDPGELVHSRVLAANAAGAVDRLVTLMPHYGKYRAHLEARTA